MLAALTVLAAIATPAPAEEPGGPLRLRPLVGDERQERVATGDTLLDIAHRHRLGFEALARLNPGVDPWTPPVGTVLRLPTRTILPDARETGLVVNLPEMRLYDFTRPGAPRILAIAVGDPSDPSPLGEFRVGRKRVDPAWNVPASIRAERPGLPAQVPPGPDNPLGSRWMTIGDTSYGIHGTNNRWSIGREATHGCIRLYEPEMQDLFERTPEGTPLQIVYQPYKWGLDGERLFLEAYPDLYGRVPDRLATALALPRALGLLGDVNLERAWTAVEEALGVPVWVGSVTPSRARALREAAPSPTSTPSS